MTITARPITDRQSWLEWRKNVVTASRVCQLPAFDCSPFKQNTPLRLFAELRGVEFPDSEDRVMRRGRWLEPAVALAVGELRPDWQIAPAREFLVDDDLELGATPDFYIGGDPRGLGCLQAKTVAPSVYEKEWEGGEVVPFWIVLQTLTECMLRDAAFGVVAALVVDAFNMDCVIHEVPRHPAAEEKIRNEVRRFMADVHAGREPDPDFARDGAMLRLLLPKETPGSIVDLSGNNEIPDKLARRATLNAEIKQHEAEIESIENEVRHIMGEAASIAGLEGWRVTWKTQHRVAYTVPAKDMRVLRINDKRPLDQRPGASDEQ
jgi:predicted phage-related endonuclease